MGTRSLFSGIAGLKTHDLRLDVISNNIANVNTTGFKASRVRFQDVLSQTIEIATSPSGGRGGQNPVQVGLGVMGATISRDMTQGSVEITNKSTDLAVQGNGFFILKDGQTTAEYYTRDGSFEVDANGDLVKGSNGFHVQGWNSVFNTQVGDFVIDTSLPVANAEINLFQQMGPNATSSITMTSNLDSRLGTALDPVRVSWTKNGVTREVEIRFTRVSPSGTGARDLYLWEVYNPSLINTATGDFTKITTDMNGLETAGIIEVNSTGQVKANYVNVADNDAADPATFFLSSSELSTLGIAESTPSLWASNNPTRSFNGYDFITLDTDANGNAVHFEEDSRISSVATATNVLDATKRDVTITVPNKPLSSTAVAGGDYPNGFTQDAIFRVGTPASGNAAVPGDGLGVPVEYVQSVSNEVVSKISTDRTRLQLAHPNILDTTRENPGRDGRMTATAGTDADSLKLFVDGTQYTRISNATAFTAGSTQFKLDPDNGVIQFGSALANGVNAIASYDYEIRPTNARSIPSASTMTAEFGARVLVGTATTWAGTSTRTIDISPFYVPGSATLTVAGQVFTEVSNASLVDSTTLNVFKIDPATGGITMGPKSDGTAVLAADTIAGSYQTFRRNAGEQTIAVVAGTPVNAAEGAFPAFPYIPGSVGTIQLTDTSAGVTETFTEVAFGSVLASRQFSVDPATGADRLSFGTFFSGAAVDEVADTFATVTHNFKFFNKQIGVTDGAGPEGAGNTRGGNDLWRVLEIPTGGSDTGKLNLWLQGDGLLAGVPIRPTATSLTYLPTISTSTNTRAEINYNSDDRVNIIIPSGLTKTPNVNPLVDKTPEAFAFAPNISQITGNAGNNNQASSGDSRSVTLKTADQFSYTTSVSVFDSLGTPHNLTLRFEHLKQNQWVVSAIDPTDTSGKRVAFQRILAFDAKGVFDATSTIPYASPAAAGTTNSTFTGIYFDPPQAGGAAPPAEGANAVQITPDFTSLLQTAKTSDAVVSTQNGFPPGDLETFSFNDEGFVVGLFDNGRSLNLARIALQSFVNPAGLVAAGENIFRDTVNAGKIGSAQRPGFDGVGKIVPGALESSNVDLSVEFVDLIITQRGFQAQSRSITTADQVLQEILGLKR